MKNRDKKVFIKPCYDVKNYESRRRGQTIYFIWGKANSIFDFFRLSLSLSLSYVKSFWKEIALQNLLIKNTRSLNP